MDFGNVVTFGTRHVVSYGGNFRRNNFDLSLAPRGSNRNEGGAYLQDEIFLSDRFRWLVDARADGFDSIDGLVFSPRYADMAQAWAGGGYRPLQRRPRRYVHQLQLRP